MIFNIFGSNDTIVIVNQTNVSIGGTGSQTNVFGFNTPVGMGGAAQPAAAPAAAPIDPMILAGLARC